MSKNNTSILGQKGEELASLYLKKKGFQILERNYARVCGYQRGEIDIVAFDKQEHILVFVEVKTRKISPHYHTLPEENITPSKLKRLAKIANVYLREKGKEEANFRFDAISVLIDSETNTASVKHIPCL